MTGNSIRLVTPKNIQRDLRRAVLTGQRIPSTGQRIPSTRAKQVRGDVQEEFAVTMDALSRHVRGVYGSIRIKDIDYWEGRAATRQLRIPSSSCDVL